MDMETASFSVVGMLMLVMAIIMPVRMRVDHRGVHVPMLMPFACQKNRGKHHEKQGREEGPGWKLSKDDQRESDTHEGCEPEENTGPGCAHSA